jgi:hypothetical protein
MTHRGDKQSQFRVQVPRQISELRSKYGTTP